MEFYRLLKLYCKTWQNNLPDNLYDILSCHETILNIYNNRGGCYKRGEFANEEEGINGEDGMVWKTWRVQVPGTSL